MPTLKQLTCSIELGGSNIKLEEYGTLYGDGYVETVIAVPEEEINFTVHLTSERYIAPGIAFFVHIDGQYQCNRNRRGLVVPSEDTPPELYQVDLRVRQKETKQVDKTFLGRAWTFHKLNTVAADRAPRINSNFMDNIGSIEVVVLRCKEEPVATTPPPPPVESRKPFKQRLTKDKPKQKAPKAVTPVASAVFEEMGMLGMFDGPSDEPENYYRHSAAPTRHHQVPMGNLAGRSIGMGASGDAAPGYPHRNYTKPSYRAPLSRHTDLDRRDIMPQVYTMLSDSPAEDEHLHSARARQVSASDTGPNKLEPQGAFQYRMHYGPKPDQGFQQQTQPVHEIPFSDVYNPDRAPQVSFQTPLQATNEYQEQISNDIGIGADGLPIDPRKVQPKPVFVPQPYQGLSLSVQEELAAKKAELAFLSELLGKTEPTEMGTRPNAQKANAGLRERTPMQTTPGHSNSFRSKPFDGKTRWSSVGSSSRTPHRASQYSGAARHSASYERKWGPPRYEKMGDPKADRYMAEPISHDWGYNRGPRERDPLDQGSMDEWDNDSRVERKEDNTGTWGQTVPGAWKRGKAGAWEETTRHGKAKDEIQMQAARRRSGSNIAGAWIDEPTSKDRGENNGWGAPDNEHSKKIPGAWAENPRKDAQEANTGWGNWGNEKPADDNTAVDPWSNGAKTSESNDNNQQIWDQAEAPHETKPPSPTPSRVTARSRKSASVAKSAQPEANTWDNSNEKTPEEPANNNWTDQAQQPEELANNNWADATQQPKEAANYGWADQTQQRTQQQAEQDKWQHASASRSAKTVHSKGDNAANVHTPARSERPAQHQPRKPTGGNDGAAASPPRIKPYFTIWNKKPDSLISEPSAVKKAKAHNPYIAPSEPLVPVPEDKAAAKGVDHQVKIGQAAPYTHLCSRPQYLDTFDQPYAIFKFKYRSKKVVENMFNVTIKDTVTSEHARAKYADMSKEQLVEEMLRMKLRDGGKESSGSTTAASAARSMSSREKVNAWDAGGAAKSTRSTRSKQQSKAGWDATPAPATADKPAWDASETKSSKTAAGGAAGWDTSKSSRSKGKSAAAGGDQGWNSAQKPESKAGGGGGWDSVPEAVNIGGDGGGNWGDATAGAAAAPAGGKQNW